MVDSTHTVPNVPVTKFKRTKIIATVGPATNSYKAILALITAGANGIRLNMSHGTYEERVQQIGWIRKAAKAYGKPVAVIADLQGPKIRLGDFEGIITLQAGQNIVLKYQADYERSGMIPTQYDLSKKVQRGERLYIYDGKVKTTITSVQDGAIHLRVENNGLILQRKGINLPDTDFGGDVMTAKDKRDLAFVSTQDVDYVAHSFVQSAGDVKLLRRSMKNLGVQAQIITKFETKAAIDNMLEIVEETDVIMIARGDLAVEVPAESVPVVQRQLIGIGMQHSKPTIVATQMLFSMTEAPEPTRAEVSDVATAVIVGADCVMLSDETANGKYPVESVDVMKRIIMYTQQNQPLKAVFPTTAHEFTRQNAICSAIISLADAVRAKVIVAETKSGATCLEIAARRPERPIIAVTSESRVAQQLAIVYGTKSYVRPDDKFAATNIINWLRKNKVVNKGDMIVTASGQHPGVVGATDTIKVRVLE